MTDNPNNEEGSGRPSNLTDDGKDQADCGSTPFDEIQSGDHSWYAEWGMNHLQNDPEKREETYQSFLVALRETCHEYISGFSDGFPIGVAEWLSKEADAALNGYPSHLLKRPEEASRTPKDYDENSFDELERLWQEGGQSFAYVVKAMSHANEHGILPPSWVLGPILTAATKVMGDREKGDDTKFDDALAFSPRRDFRKADTSRKKAAHVALMAEAIDAKMEHKDARELTLFEVTTVYGWKAYEEDTLQTYYEKIQDITSKRDGFGETFLISLQVCGYVREDVIHSFRLPSWRRIVLQIRLDAYRMADADGLSRTDAIIFVTKKTVAALKNNLPLQDEQGDFIG
jgi:hypothetical protein